jgi:hypothetical protein
MRLRASHDSSIVSFGSSSSLEDCHLPRKMALAMNKVKPFFAAHLKAQQ